MKEYILCLDVGGTEIKAGVTKSDGTVISPIYHFPSKAETSAEQILAHFVQIFKKMSQPNLKLSEMHFAFPGPFDYENGICLMKGLNKYDSLYGKNLRQAFSKQLSLAENSIRFCNDVAAFALGEIRYGQAVGAERVLFVCIGTGCGSAFSVNGRLAAEGVPGVPPHGYIYSLPFRDSCIDDYISKRGLQRLTKDYLKIPMEGKELAKRAEAGEQEAIRCFLQFGHNLCEAISPILSCFEPNCLCLGGQITKSAQWFLAPLEQICIAKDIKIYVTHNTSERSIQGLSMI